jgi:dUTP pyrophosphatase
MNNHIRFIKLDPLARSPHRANSSDAGADLYSIENIEILSLTRKLVRTGISMAIPDHMYGRIAPRSGLAFKNGIDVLAGVIDPGYRGEIGVLLYNTDQNNTFTISCGDRIAQIIFETFHSLDFQEVDYLENTPRSDGGFGSSGK